jgi:glycosyltransferase involved in cell wall biosynthesis
MESDVSGISFVVPAYNEEGAVAETLHRLVSVLQATGRSFEVILVNDGSSDDTLENASSVEGVRVLSHPINTGYGNALKTGIKNALYEWVGIIDADGSYPVDEVPVLLAEMDKGFDMVVAARNNLSQHDKPIKRLFRFLYRRSINLFTGSKIVDPNSGFRIFKKIVPLEFFDFLCGTFSFTTGLSIMAAEKPFFVKFHPVEYLDRTGKSKVRHVRDSLRTIQLIVQGVTYYNPLKFFIFLTFSLIFLVGLPAMVLAMFSMLTLSSYYMVFGCTAALLAGLGVLADVVRVSASRKQSTDSLAPILPPNKVDQVETKVHE